MFGTCHNFPGNRKEALQCTKAHPVELRGAPLFFRERVQPFGSTYQQRTQPLLTDDDMLLGIADPHRLIVLLQEKEVDESDPADNHRDNEYDLACGT